MPSLFTRNTFNGGVRVLKRLNGHIPRALPQGELSEKVKTFKETTILENKCLHFRKVQKFFVQKLFA